MLERGRVADSTSTWPSKYCCSYQGKERCMLQFEEIEQTEDRRDAPSSRIITHQLLRHPPGRLQAAASKLRNINTAQEGKMAEFAKFMGCDHIQDVRSERYSTDERVAKKGQGKYDQLYVEIELTLELKCMNSCQLLVSLRNSKIHLPWRYRLRYRPSCCHPPNPSVRRDIASVQDSNPGRQCTNFLS